MRPRSTRVTRAFTVAPMSAATSPPEPAPITTRLLSKRLGFSNRRSTRRDLTASRIFFAISGARPSSTNEIQSAGESTSPTDSIRPSSAPAFTYTTVPNSMPTWLTQ